MHHDSQGISTMNNDLQRSDDLRHPLSRVLPSRPLGPMRSPARALGWFSIALGLAELAMPRRTARVAGAPDLPALTRAMGLREIGTGIGILTSKDPTPWLWARVAGDALDIATVGGGLVTRGRPVRTLTSLAVLIGVTLIDMKVAEAAPPEKKRMRLLARDYSGRSGFPVPAAQMRGVGTRPSARMMSGSAAEPAAEDAASALPAATSMAS
jgi:hypothetical protein